jgi:hypothetical protein
MWRRWDWTLGMFAVVREFLWCGSGYGGFGSAKGGEVSGLEAWGWGGECGF